MDDSNDICVKMANWSRELTKGSAYPRQNNPSSLAWRKLLGTTELGHTMKYLLSHLKPARETQLIRKNIRHLNFNQNLLNSNSAERKCPVIKSNELGPLLEDLQLLNLKSKKLREQQERLEMQKSVLSVILTQKNEETSEYSQLSEDLQNLSKNSSVSRSSPQNIINIQRNIHEIMGELKAIRLKLIQSYQEKDPNIHDRKLDIWNSIEQLLANAPADLVITAVVNLSQLHADQLETIVKHAQVDENTNRGNSNSASDEIEKSVRDLLVAMCAKHVAIRVAAHKQQYVAKCAEAAAIVLKTNAVESFKKDNSKHLCIKYAEDLMNMKLEMAGHRSALQKMADIRNDLGRRIDMAKMAERKLIDDYRKIADFEEEAQNALFHIKGLEMNQGQSDVKITQELDHVFDLVSTSINNMSVPTPFEYMEDEFKICYQNLTDRVATCASNCDVGPAVVELSERKSRTVSSLCSYQTTWENLLFICLQQNHSNRHLKQEITRNKTDCDAMSSVFQCSNLSVKHAKDLRRKCDANDENLTSEVTPVLENCCDQLSTNYKNVFKLMSLVDDWWNQPCQRINL